jgi:hypothetical protein
MYMPFGLLNSDKNVQESDATKADSTTVRRVQKKQPHVFIPSALLQVT